MADPRHPMRDNSRALGLVSDRSNSSSGQLQDADGENSDDFARALDAALDAIRTAIDEEPELDESPDEKESQEPSAAWTMPQVVAASGTSREQHAFREISSDIAARHPELRSVAEGLKPEPRNSPMPNAATLPGKPYIRQRTPEPHTYQPYSPQDMQQNGSRTPPAATIPANDMPEVPQPVHHATSEAKAATGKEDYWSKSAGDAQDERAEAAPRARRASSVKAGPGRAAPATAAPRTRAMQPEDLPSFGRSHDDDSGNSRSKVRVLAVSAIALAAALGFGTAAVWLGNELSGPPTDGSIILTAAAPAVEPSSVLPAASSDNPARLLVTPVTGRAGDEVALDVALTAAPGERTAVLISGLPADASLSAGVDTGKGVWIVKPGDLDGLRLNAPVSQGSSNDMKFELVASNGLTLDVQTASLTLEPGNGPVSIAPEPVTAGLAPRPVKTATVTIGAPPAVSVAAVEALPRNDALPAPPIAPRADISAQISGGGGTGSAAGSQPVGVQIADRPAQSPEPGQNLLKSQAASQPASQPDVQLAAINPAPAAAPPVRVASPQPPTPEMEELVQRGNAFMNIGDLAAARLFYERAAEAGSADAALAMAKSYDPIYFEEEDVHGLPANPERAVQWYEKAAGLGSQEASSRLSALKARL